ncbi:MAG: hypothetical protein Q7R41_01575 [Phycisphaerales bacterium]|nr:hypothetical protein [Phycisphaerales bacterium]
MLYAALTFWLLVVVFTAWGVRKLWTGLVQPKVINTVLLPGTLAGVLGHVLGLLVTGATVRDTTLYKDDDSGEPETTADPKPRIPIIGPVIIGLLPLIACATGIFFNAKYLGGSIIAGMGSEVVGPQLPTTLHGFWQMLRDLISLVESLVTATQSADFHNWKTSVFVYLLVCLAVRMAPFPGNFRGALGAILILGVGSGIASSVFAVADPRVQAGWAVLNLTVAALLFLLLLSLVIRGLIGLASVLRNDA